MKFQVAISILALSVFNLINSNPISYDVKDNVDEMKYNIGKIISNSKYFTTEQVDLKIHNILNQASSEDERKEVIQWLSDVKDRKTQQKDLLRTTIMNMSTESRSFIFRIILIQQNPTLTPFEKEKRLRKISDVMSNDVRNEIAQNLLTHDHLQKFLPMSGI
uniref:DUF148 domain-containing protein n=1 Tax=Rhabditophanes sp. KR3021 TaxID=114890 RepID=A0AC35U4F8_9BILA